jgi:hypothetical protein
MEIADQQSKHYYLLDASYICRLIQDCILERDSLDIPFHNITANVMKGNFYYIPQFCIAEVFNTFAKWYYHSNENDKKNTNTTLTSDQYKRINESFKILIRNRRVLYAYDLHRYHNLNCDKIFETEHTTPRKKGSWLSTYDILIIAMAMELQRIHGENNITILADDRRLLKIAGLLNVQAQDFLPPYEGSTFLDNKRSNAD